MVALGGCVVVQLNPQELPRGEGVSSGALERVLHLKLKSTCSEVKGLHEGLKYLYPLEAGFQIHSCSS